MAGEFSLERFDFLSQFRVLLLPRERFRFRPLRLLLVEDALFALTGFKSAHFFFEFYHVLLSPFAERLLCRLGGRFLEETGESQAGGFEGGGGRREREKRNQGWLLEGGATFRRLGGTTYNRV